MAKNKKAPKWVARLALTKKMRRKLRDLTATETGRAVLLAALARAVKSVEPVESLDAEPAPAPTKARKRAAADEAAAAPEPATPAAAAPATDPPPPTPTAH